MENDRTTSITEIYATVFVKNVKQLEGILFSAYEHFARECTIQKYI